MFRILSKYLSLFIVINVLAAISYHALAQQPVIKWQISLGGSGDDVLTDMQVTTDKGFIVSGYSASGISATKSEYSYGSTYDFWIIKLDSNGTRIWDHTFGGNNSDFASSVIQTSDGGFLIGGSTLSDATGNKTEGVQDQSYDYWAIKLDKNGVVKWQNTFGGSYTERLTCLTEVSDGYLAGGISYSDFSGDKKSANFGSEESPDYWVAKLRKPTGALAGTQIYGSTNHDYMTCMIQDATGRLFGGYSYSPKKLNKTAIMMGNCDYWVQRVNLSNGRVWDYSYGGSGSDRMTCMVPSADNGTLLGGYSYSVADGNKMQASYGFDDYWIVKINSAGGKLWDKSIGGGGGDYMTSVAPTADKGFLLGGYSNSAAGNSKSENSKGDYDYWIVKVDSMGTIQWDKTYGGARADKLGAVRQISVGEYIMAGTSNSRISGDKTTDTLGGNDMWIVRISTNQTLRSSHITNTIASTAIINTPIKSADKLLLSVTPNPVTTSMNINYSSAGNAKLSLSLMNNDGKTLFTKTLAPGAGTYNVNAAKLPAGIYYAVLQSGTSTVTRAVVKQ